MRVEPPSETPTKLRLNACGPVEPMELDYQGSQVKGQMIPSPIKANANHHLMMAQRRLQTERHPSSTRRRREGSQVRNVMREGAIMKYLLASKGEEKLGNSHD